MNRLRLDGQSVQMRIVPNCHPDGQIWCCLAHGTLNILCGVCNASILTVNVSGAVLRWSEPLSSRHDDESVRSFVGSFQKRPTKKTVGLRDLARSPEHLNKLERACQLLSNAAGANLSEIAQACGWAQNTTLSQLTIIRRVYVVEHSKNGTEDHYRLVAETRKNNPHEKAETKTRI